MGTPHIGMGRDVSIFQIGESPYRYGVHSNLGTNMYVDSMVLSSSYTRYSTKVVFTKFPSDFDYIKLNTPFLHTRGINMPCRISCKYLNFQRGITATPVALGSMMRVALPAAQRKTLRFMDSASLYFRKLSCAGFAQSANSAQNCTFAPSLRISFSS